MDRNPDNNKQIVKALIIDPNIAKKAITQVTAFFKNI